MKLANGLILILALFFSSACGYQLRGGAVDIPESLKNVYVVGATPSLQTEMAGMLKASNGKIVSSTKDAGIVVKILREKMTNRIVSIGATGKSTESELNYYLRFQFFDNQDKPLMDEQTLEVAREYFNDQTAILAKSSEELLIRTEIYKQVARMLMVKAKIAIDNSKKIDKPNN